MHQLILDSVRGSKKSLGEIRTTQNWIGPRGCTQENATFIPPKPKRLMDYWKIYISIWIISLKIHIS